MKKYLVASIAVVFAIVLSAFTKPDINKSRLDYYSFAYQAPFGSYTQADVQSRSTLSWGYGTKVPLPDFFVVDCDQTSTLEKACEIIVAEAQTTVVGVSRRLRTPADGGSPVIISAYSAGLHTSTYMVNAAGSTNILNVYNKTY
jgi:hypothetical protein